jgi:hypothetical protein
MINDKTNTTTIKETKPIEAQYRLDLIARAKAAFTRRCAFLQATDGRAIPFQHKGKQYYEIDLSGPCLDCEIDHLQHYATYIYSPHGDRLRISQDRDNCNRVVP